MNKRWLLVAVGVGLAIAGWLLWRGNAGTPEGKQAGASTPKTASRTSRQASMTWEEPSKIGDGGLTLRGQVMGPDQKLVPGATVWLQGEREQKADENGEFEFSGLASRTYELSAHHELLTGGPVSVYLHEGTDPVVIHMGAAQALAVRVLDAKDQSPIVGAFVKLKGDLPQEFRTNATGEARVVVPRNEGASLAVRADGYGAIETWVPRGEEETTVLLVRGVPVSGRVLDETGKGIAGAKVSIATKSWDQWPRQDTEDTRTNDAGEFVFAAVSPGARAIEARSPQFVRGELEQSLDVATTPIKDLVITLKKGGVLRGVVTTNDGKPASSARVLIGGDDVTKFADFADKNSWTDEKGEFVVAGLPDGALWVSASAGDASSQAVEAKIAAGTEATVKLVLDQVGTIAGMVVDESGASVPEVQVSAFQEDLQKIFRGQANGDTVYTDGGGNFVLRGLPNGEYRVAASRVGFERKWRGEHVVAKTGDVNVRVKLAKPARIRGKLVLPGGAAPKTAIVRIGNEVRTIAKQGAFTLEDVAPGKHRVTATGPEFLAAQQEVTLAAGEQKDLGTWQLEKGRTLTGSVVDVNGAPVANARIMVIGRMSMDADESDESLVEISSEEEALASLMGSERATSDEQGRFAVTGMRFGKSRVFAEVKGKGKSLRVEIPAGKADPAPIQLTLLGFGTVKGIVTKNGKPVKGFVTASVGRDTSGSSTQSAADGTYTLSNVTAGRAKLTAGVQSGMGASGLVVQEVDVKEGATTEANFDIKTGQLSLEVTLAPKGEGQVGLTIFVLARGLVSITTIADMQTQFESKPEMLAAQQTAFGLKATLAELDAGTYTLCSIPLVGNPMDPAFQEAMQKELPKQPAQCTKVVLAASPAVQQFTHEVNLPKTN